MRWYIFHSEISHNIYQVLQVSWALSLSFKALKDSEEKKKNSKNRNNSKKTRKKTEKNEPIYVIIHTNIHREGEREKERDKYFFHFVHFTKIKHILAYRLSNLLLLLFFIFLLLYHKQHILMSVGSFVRISGIDFVPKLMMMAKSKILSSNTIDWTIMRMMAKMVMVMMILKDFKISRKKIKNLKRIE